MLGSGPESEAAPSRSIPWDFSGSVVWRGETKEYGAEDWPLYGAEDWPFFFPSLSHFSPFAAVSGLVNLSMCKDSRVDMYNVGPKP